MSAQQSFMPGAANDRFEPEAVVGLGHLERLLDEESWRSEAMLANGSMYRFQSVSDRCFCVLFVLELSAFARIELGVSPT